jgi:DNA (cytosine-5)-methyltransferase 1
MNDRLPLENHCQKSQNRPIAVDLFAGAGGMTLGFEQAGFDVLAAVEIDPVHCATHEFNFPFWTILCRSVTDITGREIREGSSIGSKEIDVVFGGPPCQGFSLMGKRALDDPRNHLVYHYIRLVLELQPKYFVMENVKGMTLGKHQHFLAEIIDIFHRNGYQVEPNYKILNAAHYGVPQNRERLFLLGCRKGLKLPVYPRASYRFKPDSLRQIPNAPNVWEAIADLPLIENYPQLWQQDAINGEFSKPSKYAKILRCLEVEKLNYAGDRSFDSRLLTSSLRTKHSLESIQRFAQTPHGKIEPISHFHKLHPQGLCNTLRAGTAGNRGAFTSPRPIHPFIPRCITVREAARLHSYPDWFRFHATKWHGFRQIGNSVPPLLARSVAAEIAKVLQVTPVKPQILCRLGDEKLLKFNMSQAKKYYDIQVAQNYLLNS